MGKVNFINRHNLKIARLNVGLEIDYASKRVSKRKNIVLMWENGEDLPTWSQIRKLAKLYDVQELIFFSKDNTKENRNISDFRVGVLEGDKDVVKKLINLVLRRQAKLEQIFRDEGYSKNVLIGSGKHIESPIELARYISRILKINIEEIKNISGADARRKTLDYLIEKAEQKGIFVGKTISYHNISVNNMRGLFISNDYCPFIVLNRKDALVAQIFSLIHELSHLFRRTESISNIIDFRDFNKDIDSEEVFCNKVAANLLLPAEEFTEHSYSKRDITALSEKYKLSELFIFYRLKDLGKITQESIDSLQTELEEESKENIKRKESRDRGKGGNYYNSMKDSNGGLFNKTILSAYFEKRISYVEASNLLNFSVEKV
jgi:Zn-dependent peptidase ImmA (M78 family)/DNA-binding XRE family transcriptional regulator